MKELFDEKGLYTTEACRLARDAVNLLKPLIRRYMDEGYKTRDIQMILESALDMHVVFEHSKWVQEQRTKESNI